MNKTPYTPPITEAEVVHLENNFLASVDATGANVIFDTEVTFDSLFY